MKKYLLVLIIALIGISTAHAAKVTCPIKYNGKELMSMSLVSNGYNNYLKCSYGGLVSDEQLPQEKHIFQPVNIGSWIRGYSSLSLECFTNGIKRPTTDAVLQELAEKCAVFECPRKGPCIL